MTSSYDLTTSYKHNEATDDLAMCEQQRRSPASHTFLSHVCDNVTVAHLIAVKALRHFTYHHAFNLTSRTVKYSEDDYFPKRLS